MPNYQPRYVKQQRLFNRFIENYLHPHAKIFDKEQNIPRVFFHTLAQNGFLGACIPKQFGGQQWDELTIGIMHESFAKELCSLANILTVIGMVSKSLLQFGSKAQKQIWLPRIATGETLAALALTESNIGSDLEHVETQLLDAGDEFILKGSKKYITLGQIADLFLVLANCQGQLTAVLVEKDTPGLIITPMSNFLGLRSNMLAEIFFDNCRIPKTNLLGSIGIGFNCVIQTALDEGRYTTAYGCVGLGQACLDAALGYTQKRKQFDRRLDEHQLIQKMITEMVAQVKAARELCFYAGELRQQKNPAYIAETLIAKYAASKMVVFVSNHALQIFGAAGFEETYPVERYYRDAKVMEIIEGTSQMHEILISKLCNNK
ncbi:acyl-CoA dehydrogenase family protein [Legionella pneumophila]|uniref:acyl-CoA dehydrogenase family protein n=1 Tax=Legionella pneumophila TaxID=446 RepID=UPI00026DA35E|nr:acyl-CoA dehydrogenase family protein [Legionella pneumophila]CCD09334.1 acyl CoA dehydrogenase [Legionella pneumophila subsp. pneumophila]CZH46869.1 Acyl-CoA dehydrogenase%2C short-chain specific [Legionella pneumophila]CZJ85280.1 Acyl-CoA dehydrogenase%2C short-chain specific [Legionella pneumophila]CZR10819.1 Acyl-CoA dehydrogenase%2C short-chain specific [Legionella pneumophila]STX66974.1 Acyl-CoA dehydrogenase [Legionella pneumophila]